MGEIGIHTEDENSKTHTQKDKVKSWHEQK
jgi:hypothetical protein